MHALGVLVELGPARAAADGLDLRHAEDELFGNQADAIGFGERNARD